MEKPDLSKPWGMEISKAHSYFSRKPAKCPVCGSKRIARIQYGLPVFTPKLQQDLEEGRVVLGGCVMGGDDPAWMCVDCNTCFGKRRKP